MIKLIKTKVYFLRGQYVEKGTTGVYVADYCFCIYFFGMLVHSVTLVDITQNSFKSIFGNKEIIYPKQKSK